MAELRTSPVASAHVDDFGRRHLPPPELWPRMEFALPELHYPPRLNVATALLDDAVARGWSEKTVLHFHGERWTYRRLFERSNQIAQVLVEDLHILPGNRVLLRGPNNPMLFACWFAVLKAGGVVVCTMPLLRQRELDYIIHKAQVDFALCDARFAADLEAAISRRSGSRMLCFNGDSPTSLEAAMRAKTTDFENVDMAADDVAIIAFTSGTTGRGKGTLHFHRDLLAVCDTFARHVLKPTPDDVFVGSPPLAFTYALGGLLLFPMRVGASSLLLEEAHPPQLLEAIVKHRPTICFTSPTAYRAMLPKLRREDVASLRKCVSAGEHLPRATFEAWEKATGIRIIDGIGSTEMLHIFISETPERAKAGSTGRVVPGYSARIIDDDGRAVSRGEIGRLAVIGPTGCRYLDSEDDQRKYVQHGWNLTGDSYIQDADGYFWYQARTDDMIICSGYNISGPEVENVLLEHPSVAECAVVGAVDETRGATVKAFVVLKGGHKPSDALCTELQAHVKREIAPYKYPRLIEFVDALPRTLTGKLQRFKLREPSPASSADTMVLPEGWPKPSGYAQAMIARGRMVAIAGQIGWNPLTSNFETDDFAAQTAQALRNIVAVLRAAGGEPAHIIRLTWFITSRDEYLAARKEIGRAYREIMGAHYPAMSVVVAKELIEPRAKVEIEATAVLPE